LCALALALALPGAGLQAQTQLPALGDAASEDLSVGDERRLGEQIMRQIRADPDYLDDPVLQDYVQGLWTPLVRAARASGHIGPELDAAFAWEAFLVRDRSVNAFALPGGHVGVYLGLIAMTTHTDELASVLAHELSHVTQRHIARSLGNAQRQGMVGMAAMILAVIASARAGNADATQAAIVGSQAAMLQGQLNYSRDMEREADRIGFGVLDGAGFSAQGMASMFEKLAFANRLNDSGAFPYLRSHPLTTERISEARERAGANAPARSPSTLHGLMRARARVLMDPSAQALRRLQEVPAAVVDPAQALAARYAQALASVRLADAPAARQALEALQQQAAAPAVDDAARRAVQRLAAEAWLALGSPAQAAEALAQAGADGGRPGLLLRSQLALAQAADKPQAVRAGAESLQVWTAEHPDDAQAWTLLAQTAEAAGLPLRAQRAGAEARVAIGDLPGAVDRLRAAQRAARAAGHPEAIEAQVIDARLRSLEQQLREWRAENRAAR